MQSFSRWVDIARKWPLAVLGILCATALSVVLFSCEVLERVEVTGSAITLPRTPYWNVWVQDFSPGNPPKVDAPLVEGVVVGQAFTMVVDLSTVAYMETVRSEPVSREVQRILLESKRDTVTLDVIAIPEEQFFRTKAGQQKVTSLTIDLRKYRSLERDASAGSSSPRMSPSRPLPELSLMALDEKFSLGRAALHFEARNVTGRGNIALSFWVDNRPIDELSVTVCVKGAGFPDCPTEPELKGAPSGMLGQYTRARPEAALHLLALSSESIAGVFYCSMCDDQTAGRYFTWQLPLSRDRLSAIVERQLVPMFDAASNPSSNRPNNNSGTEAFRAAGGALYESIFKAEQGVKRPTSAERAFLQFVTSARREASRTPVLFVRVIHYDHRFLLLPLNLMLVPAGEEGETYLGFVAAVESHLGDLVEATSQTCIRRWVLLVPEAVDGQPLANARKPFEPWVARFKRSSGRDVYEARNVNKFRDWLWEDKLETTSIGVITLSHHYEDRLCFSSEKCDGPDAVISSRMRRAFSYPSMVIINGCGTSGLGTSEFVQSFRASGMTTVIATSFKVYDEMAGNFMRLLAEQLESHGGDPNYTLSQARFDAVRVLSRVVEPGQSAPYGPSALSYTLIGDGQVRACVPARK